MASAAVQERSPSASAEMTEPPLEQMSAQEEAAQSSEVLAQLSDVAQLDGAVADVAQPTESQEAQRDARTADDSHAAQFASEAGMSTAARPANLASASEMPLLAGAGPAQPLDVQSAQESRQQSSRTVDSNSVGFQPSESTVTSKVTTPNQPRTPHSTWRWPELPGRLPPYVQRAFRLKAFSLLFAQLAFCFAGSIIVKEMDERALLAEAMMSSVSFWILCAISVALLWALYAYRNAYPVNYILLVLNAVSITLTWSFGGMSGVLFEKENHLHLQVLGIMVIGVFVMALVGHALSICKMESEVLVPVSFLLGWFVGAMANLMLVSNMEDAEGSPFSAAGIAFLLYGIVLIDVGAMLMDANPDSFMRVVISFDSTLLVITSIPFLLLSVCLVRGYKSDTEDRERRPAQDGRPARERRRAHERLPAQHA